MSVADHAWLKYVDEVRRDPSNLYYCARLLEKTYLLYSLPDGAELMRKVALTGIATSATPDNERNYGEEDGGKRSRNILAVGPRI